MTNDLNPSLSSPNPAHQTGYWQYSHLLLLAGFFYLLVWFITHYVPPSTLANWLYPDSYLLVQLLLAAGNFLAGTYLGQNRQWGKFFALTAFTWLFFRFQHCRFNLPLVIGLLTSTIFWGWWLIFRPLTSTRHPAKTSPQPK